MSGYSLIELAISVAGIAVLVAFSWMLGAMRGVAVTRESAAERLAFDEPDFRASEWRLGVDGRCAAAMSADVQETALVFAVGDGLVSRRFRLGAVGVRLSGDAIEFSMGEPSLQVVRLVAPDKNVAEQWILTFAGRRL